MKLGAVMGPFYFTVILMMSTCCVYNLESVLYNISSYYVYNAQQLYISTECMSHLCESLYPVRLHMIGKILAKLMVISPTNKGTRELNHDKEKS